MSWVIDFNRFSGKAQVRRATLSCDSSYYDKRFCVLLKNLVSGLCLDMIKENQNVAVPVAEQLRALFLNHSIISLLCLVWVRAPLWPCETSQVLLVVVPGGFSWDSPVFVPPIDWPLSYELK